MKTMFVDCETTGVEHREHGLIQVAGAIYDGRKQADHFNLTLAPFPDDAIEDGALEVNKRTREEIAGFPDPRRVYEEFVGRLEKVVDRYDRKDKMHLVGYNANFDADFLRAWFEKCGDEYFGSWFWWPVVDVAQIAGVRLIRERARLRDFKLMTVAEHLGVPLPDGDAHDALYDIRVTMRMFKLLTQDLPWFSRREEEVAT